MREEAEVIEVKMVSCSEEHYAKLIQDIRTTMQRIRDDKSSEGSGDTD
jgi:hypothetical protein